MAALDSLGMLVDSRVQRKRYPQIEQGRLKVVHAIVVHQTDSTTEQSVSANYQQGGNHGAGAHFLIAKSGLTYQTASLHHRCFHVGRLIKSKCLELHKQQCSDANALQLATLAWSAQIKALDTHERAKAYPHRYPVNDDSVGIELVGRSVDTRTYEAVTPSQNDALRWLVSVLHQLFSLTNSDVYRHPEASYKNPGEAATARWQ
jgi:N-acetyl-anhydromuramyl-L-alanine amidase AmpD